MAALAVIALLAFTAAPVAAHPRLERSTPAAGDTLRRAPTELRLFFSEPVTSRYTSLTLFSPAGDVIALVPLHPDSVRASREFVASTPALPAAGDYRVEWKTVGADGHVVAGSFSFTLLPPAAAPPPAPASDPSLGPDRPESANSGYRVPDAAALPPLLRPDSWLSLLTRFLQLAAIIGLIGAAVFRTLVLPGAGLMPTVQHRLSVTAHRFAALALTVFGLALMLRLWLQSAALHGVDQALDPALLGSYLTTEQWGQAWLAQLIMAALAASALITSFTPLLALGTTVLAFTPAFQGHAVVVEPASRLALVADGVHVLAAGAWIGTLAVLLTAALPGLFHAGMERGGHDMARLIGRFSPLALVAAGMLIAAGIVSSLLHFHTLAELATTAYGRTLLLKLALVALVLGAGWYNWKRARPALPLHTGVRAVRRAAALELLLAVAALAVTAALVAVPPP